MPVSARHNISYTILTTFLLIWIQTDWYGPVSCW